MNKIKSLTEILLSVYLLRLLITGASIGDAAVILSLSGLYGFYMYLEARKVPEVNQDIKTRLADAEKMVQAVNSKISAIQIRR